MESLVSGNFGVAVEHACTCKAGGGGGEINLWSYHGLICCTISRRTSCFAATSASRITSSVGSTV